MSGSLRRASAQAFLLAGLAAASLRGVAAQPDPCRGSALSSPTSGSVISGTVEVLGSARIDGFGFYKLEWASEARPANWSAVSNVVSQPQDRGVLDRWNTQALPDGLYRLKLTVVDQVGQEICRQTASRLQLANQGPPPTASATPGGSPTPDASGDDLGDDLAGEADPAATLPPGVPSPVQREGAGADSSDGTSEGSAGEEDADAATPAPVDIAPADEPSGERLPSFGELACCFGASFLATVALALWLWRRGGSWTG